MADWPKLSPRRYSHIGIGVQGNLMSNTNARVLVTGGAGMIGSRLVKVLKSQNYDVLVVDNLWRGKLENLNDEFGKPVIDLNKNFKNLDLTIPNQLDSLLNDVEVVFHLADVVAGISYVFQNQGDVFRKNILINSNVIDSVRKAKAIKGFIYTGTACSFPAHLQSGVDARPLKEEDQYPASPESSYGWSKLMGEYEALLMEQECGIPVSVLVLHNVYGSPCDLDDSRTQVIPSLIKRAIRFPQEPFTVWGSGAQGRAFLHVEDVVTALISAMKYGLGAGVIQIGPDVCTSIKDIATIICDIADKGIEIQYDLTRPEGDKGRRADASKARELLNWTPKVILRDGLQELYDWINNRVAK